MFYSKLRHNPSNSIIDISSIQHTKNVLSKSNHNQNRAQSQSRLSSYLSDHQLCHSCSDDSLNKEFIQNTKQTLNKLFLQSNFNKFLDQIQCTLQPIVDQLRQQIQRKKYLSQHDRLICMKSCAKFIIEILLNEQWNVDDNFSELYRLQHVLDRFLSNQRPKISTQTSEQLETDMMKLHIDNSKKTTKVSFVSVDQHQIPLQQSTDNLTRQKLYHKSVSRVFKKLNTDLQKLHHEIPFQGHLSKYHKHNH